MTMTFVIPKPMGFHVRAASDFYAGFTPGSGMAAAAVDWLTFAFRVDRTFEAAALSLHEQGEQLSVHLVGKVSQAAALKQLGRMLGWEADPAAWLALGARVPLVGKLQREFPGFLTATKASPYDAAVWAVISPRMQQEQAARIKLALAQQHGTELALNGRVFHVFPAPATLLSLERVEGLSEEKVLRLRGVARAALDGFLDAEHLRAMEPDAALAQLQSLRGIGPWSASHIYYRGAAPCDGLPTAEPRVLHGLALASDSHVPTAAEFERTAASWRPFRMWVSVLLSRLLARTPGWSAPGLQQERVEAGKALAQRTRSRTRGPQGSRAVRAAR